MTALTSPLKGLVAAAFTPLKSNGDINLGIVGSLVDYFVSHGMAATYVLGSTGEGLSLTADERRAVAEAFVEAAAGRLPVIVQVGCESLFQAQDLAAHAQQIGADAISAVSPVYFKPDSVEDLVDSMALVASGAPNLPFYYYHIPMATGLKGRAVEFLQLGQRRIETLRGIKFTSPDVHEFQACIEAAENRVEILWGLDEMLLFGLTAGAQTAVGSTINFAAPIYRRITEAIAAGDLDEARDYQSLSQLLVATFTPYGHRAAQKAIMSMVGPDCGPCRLPLRSLTARQTELLRKDLEAIGFFEWSQPLTKVTS
ncbi:MAG: dihydrodipicolinate synthase family protein [Pirellulales bacterium]|nr:dihydrodipicolinate synthase family protein [Pirellulales bacterium]